MKVLKKATALLIVLACMVPFLGVSVNAAAPEIKSQAAVLIDAKTGQILFEKNKDEKLYPASITKIMTIYLAAQNDDGGLATASETAIKAVPRDTSNIAIDYGEQFSVAQLMYAAQLMSANDACNVMAEHISGSISDFVALMNKTAKQFGTRNTNFTNANGLMDENHYTTAYDFALITMNAIQSEDFMRIFSTVEYSIPYTNKKQETRNMVAQHRMMHLAKYKDMGVVGGKAGYTSESQHTLVTYGKKNGIEVIAVVLKSPDFNTVYSDTEALLNYGYTAFESVTVSAESIEPKVEGYTTYTPKGAITFWVEKDASKEFTYIYKGNQVDVVSSSGNVMGTLMVESYTKTPAWKTVLKVIGIIFLVIVAWLIFMYIVLIVRHNKKKRRRKALRNRYK